MLTDKQLQMLSEQSYWLEEKRKDVEYHPKEGFQYYYTYKNKELGQFQVLKVEDNTENGMQAMAVAPVIDGKVDTSQIVIAYAGTNFMDGKDRQTDIKVSIV